MLTLGPTPGLSSECSASRPIDPSRTNSRGIEIREIKLRSAAQWSAPRLRRVPCTDPMRTRPIREPDRIFQDTLDRWRVWRSCACDA